ncbi:hypothetical protein OFAG_00539 [Oxalobacter formigenes HOxBLS]|uniref:Uncharacterized protein n=1 Tax=Oxalobacter paraformigenes TaxID=556268 RepID=C3X2F0_9BURK|nr:hypothetical protein OFAG_00539 [Oxalobacter paraformigenes]
MKASGMDGGIANAGDGTIFALAPDSDSAWEAGVADPFDEKAVDGRSLRKRCFSVWSQAEGFVSVWGRRYGPVPDPRQAILLPAV